MVEYVVQLWPTEAGDSDSPALLFYISFMFTDSEQKNSRTLSNSLVNERTINNVSVL